MTDVLDRRPEELGVPSAYVDTETEASELDEQHVLARVGGWLGSLSAESIITLAVVVGVTVFTLMQLSPGNLVRNTTPSGGDMGAHVWAFGELRDDLLPNGRLAGWSPDWYGGFPAFKFYMVIPFLAMVVLDLVMPFGVAMKLVTVSGILTLPVACWAFGKLAGLRFPVPPLLAVAGTFFLFDPTFTIYGGNIASTLAGEFAFSISLSFGVLYLGTLVYGLRTGRARAWSAALLALCGLCHIIVAIFCVVATVVIFLCYAARLRAWHLLLLVSTAAISLGALALAGLPLGVGLALAGLGAVCFLADRERFTFFLPSAVVAACLGAFWVLPFLFNRMYMTDMGYERITRFSDLVFPYSFRVDVFIHVMCVIALLFSLVRGRRLGIALGLLAVIFGVWTVVQPQSILWNARLTPFLTLLRYFLVAMAAAELLVLLARWIAGPERGFRRALTAAIPVLGLLAVIGVVGVQLRVLDWLPFAGYRTITKDDGTSQQVYALGPFTSAKGGVVRGWAQWNYSGYEAKNGYGEYRAIVQTMAGIGEDDRFGCGRAQWEYVKEQDRYGTPMALMLLPFWTDDCIGSMEGLYFEASASTPYHFLTNSAVSEAPSRPVRGLTYDNTDLSKGVQYMALLGNRYYMAFSEPALAQARERPELTEIATSGPWHVFQVANSDLVVPLSNEPAVVEGMNESKESWLDHAEAWFTRPDQWSVFLAADGPESWQRIAATEIDAAAATPEGQLGLASMPEQRALPAITVADIVEEQDAISFRVSEPGVPVLVKVSSFPNWAVDGAEGPYRVAPNLMVVVPTENEVRLTYERSSTEYAGYGLTVLGLVGLVMLWRMGPRRFAPAASTTGEGAWSAQESPGLLLWDDGPDGEWAPVGEPEGWLPDEAHAPPTQAVLFSDPSTLALAPLHGPPAPVSEPVLAPIEADESGESGESPEVTPVEGHEPPETGSVPAP
jgi:hypothetical protein